jgi:glycerol uptake facilitator-like aquaporin
MGESLAQGNDAVALLVNSLATGLGLLVLIQCLGPISGAHLNPAVSLVEALWGNLSRQGLVAYWFAQFAGAVLGVVAAHVMFGQAVFQVATRVRFGAPLWFSEAIATFGLISVVALAGRTRVESAPFSIAAYVTAAYWFTSSSAFANPALTLARMFTDTFSGISPVGVVPFVVAQLFGTLGAFLVQARLRERKAV